MIRPARPLWVQFLVRFAKVTLFALAVVVWIQIIIPELLGWNR